MSELVTLFLPLAALWVFHCSSVSSVFCLVYETGFNLWSEARKSDTKHAKWTVRTRQRTCLCLWWSAVCNNLVQTFYGILYVVYVNFPEVSIETIFDLTFSWAAPVVMNLSMMTFSRHTDYMSDYNFCHGQLFSGENNCSNVRTSAVFPRLLSSLRKLSFCRTRFL